METKKILNNPLIKGTFILTFTGILSRIMGFYNRIFLSNLIGAKELGIYQLILPLYITIFSFTTFGNETALTKIVSETENKQVETKKIYFKICLIIGLILSLPISLYVYNHAYFISTRILKTKACIPALKLLAIAIPSLSIKGTIHGYFLGEKDSSVHGISDLIEQLAKILGLYLISTIFFIKNPKAEFAVLGIIIGEYFSLLYSIYRYIKQNAKRKKQGKIIKKQNIFSLPLNQIKYFLKLSIPITINRCSITVLSSMEAILIPSLLFEFFNNSTKSITTYGILTGLSFPFIMFPATITNSISTMLMPSVSYAYSQKQTKKLTKMIQFSVSLCLLIGILSTLIFYFTGKEIGILIKNPLAGIYLNHMALLCPFIYLSTVLSSILLGLGHATTNLIQTIISTIFRIIFIQFFIPKFGVTGYILGLFFSYMLLTILASVRLSYILKKSYVN